MIPLLFVDPQWIKKHPVPAILIAVIFISLSIAVVDKWKNRNE